MKRIIATDPFEFGYIFIKAPTLKGFTEFLRSKTEEKP